MFTNFIPAIKSIGKFSDREAELIAERLEIRTFSKGDHFHTPGDIAAVIGFINKGSFRQYHYSEKGAEITTNLFTEFEWLADFKSLTSQKPAEHPIVATEDSEVFTFTVHDLHHLITLSPVYFKIGRILEKGMTMYDFRSGSLSPDERYRMLLESRPTVLAKFPLKYIASFLDITPETLSRVRARLSL